MTLSYTYNGGAVTHKIAPSGINIPSRAEMGDPGMGGIPIEDPTATLAIVAHKPFYVEESACTQPRLWTGWTTQRDMGRSLERGQFVGDDARLVDVTIVCLNAALNFRLITGTDGNRPSETWNQRMAWLLASDYLDGLVENDTTFVDSRTIVMNAADYRDSYPAAVLQDLDDRTGNVLNFFLFWDPTDSDVKLFMQRTGETTYTSTLAISNDPADVDSSVTFYPNTEAVLSRQPDTTYSGVVVNYTGGRIYRRRASSEAAFVQRETTISRPYTKSATTASNQAEGWLDEHAAEQDRISVTIRVPADTAGLVTAGQRISVKFTHLDGYTAATYMRVATCSPKPVDDTATMYDIALELVGSRAEPPAGFHQVILTAAGLPQPPVVLDPGSGVFEAVWCGRQSGGGVTYGTAPVWQDTDGYANTVEGGDPVYGYYATGVTIPAGLGGTYRSCWGEVDISFLYDNRNVPGGDIADPTATEPYRAGTPQQTGCGAWVAMVTIHYNIKVNGSIVATTTYGPTGMSYGHGEASDDTQITVAAGDVVTFEIDITTSGTGNGNTIGIIAYGSQQGFWCLTLVESDPSSADVEVPLPPDPTGVLNNYGATTDPTVNDDANDGYQVGSQWVNVSTGNAWVLVDSTAGAAVWVLTTGAGAPTTVDYLVGTATGALSAEIVAGTTPGGELGGTWASPTVDATHSGSAHLALGATSSTAAAGNHTHAGGELLVADGTSGPSGVNTSSYVEMTTQRTTTSGSLADITGVTTTITLQRAADIAVWLNCEVSASGAAADLGLAINLNGSDHDEVVTHLAAGGSDSGVSSVIHRTATPLGPGTYTVKGRFRRTAGAGTPAVDRADLLVMSMGENGPVMLTNEAEDDYLYGEPT